MKNLLLLFLLLLSFSRISLATARDEVRVLVLHSLDVTYPYVKSKVDGLAFEGANHQKTVLLDIHSLEDERYTDPEKLHHYYTTEAQQLKNSHPDVIAITGSPVIFSFYNNFLYPLMPDVPMVGETRITPADHKPPAYSFIEYHQNIPETIDMALKLTQPETVYLIGDATHPGSRLSMQLVEQHISKNFNVKVKRLEMPIQQLLKAAKDLPKNSVAFFNLIFSDGKGKRMVPERALQSIADLLPFPIYAFHETMIGSGATGGVVAKGKDVGIQLVKESLLALEFGPFSPPRIVPAVSTTLFDWHYMDKFHLPLNKLPDKAEVINMTSGWQEQYLFEALLAITLIITLGPMLAILFYSYRKRNINDGEVEQRIDDITQTLLEENQALHKKETEITQLMLTDALTGLPNRRYFEDVVNREFQRSVRTYSNFCIAFCDIDNFKQVNDLFGHNAGDKVLISLAQCINQTVRQSDFLARWGGEEFVIILIDSDRNSAVNLAERVRKSVKDLWFEEIGSAITISIGIAQRNPEDSLSDVIQRSDQALYTSKENGRNQVTFKEQTSRPVTVK